MVFLRKIGLFLLLFIGLFIFNPIFSQDMPNEEGQVTPAEIQGNDTLAVVNLWDYYVISAKPYTKRRYKRKYSRLAKKVIKVYPYAMLAGYKLRAYNDTLIKMNKSQQKKYMKKAEKDLTSVFGNQLKNLTRSEGRILIRLIDRQTNNTSYELVKELRGSFPAFFWQTLARLFGNNLKTEYNPELNKQDEMIERIIYHVSQEKGWIYIPYNKIQGIRLFSNAS